MNRFLARSGVASRRDADRLIAAGGVTVNGRRPPPDGMMVDPERDEVAVGSKRIQPPRGHAYLALNKPPGVMVTARDPEARATVFDLLDPELVAGRRLFPIGRLDYSTRGLLLLTDDGELADRLGHARHGVAKEYIAVVSGVPTAAQLQRLRDGVVLEDGPTLPAEVELLRFGPGARAELRMVIREGRNRQVRRMLEAIDHPVRDLLRTAVGPVRLGHLQPGTARKLRPAELAALRQLVESNPGRSPRARARS